MSEESTKIASIEKLSVSIDQLTVHPDNAKKHDDEGIQKSISDNGYIEPIVVDENLQILAGHGRMFALKKQGFTKIDVIQKKGLTEEQKKKYIVMSNRLTELGGWDMEKLVENFDMDTLVNEFGFNDYDFDGIGIESENSGKEEIEVKEDNFEVSEEITTDIKEGDIFQLGNHRLICGDAIKEKDVSKLMGGKKAKTVFTSPPYNGNINMTYDKKEKTELHEKKPLYERDSDNKTSEEYINFCNSAMKMLFSNCEGFIFWNVNYNGKSRYEYIKCVYPFLEYLWETIVWKKSLAMPISYGLTRIFELIFCFKSGEVSHLGKQRGKENNFWQIDNFSSQDKDNIRACFPVALPAKGITISSDEGDIVLDSFGGSGTTMIACEQLKRKCYMVELDPIYCQNIINRWEKFTDKKAVKV